jgi:hypothetical protein
MLFIVLSHLKLTMYIVTGAQAARSASSTNEDAAAVGQAVGQAGGTGYTANNAIEGQV